MSVQREIDRIRSNIAAAYEAVAEKNGTLPALQDSANLAAAIASIPFSPTRIYGVAWTDPQSARLTRTDSAAAFPDPVPAVGNGAGTSPFDHCYPWSGMKKVTEGDNVLVEIPKFWVKVSQNPFSIRIADKPVEGYQVSPAHRDRGDGQGERDAVYIGRYECDAAFCSRSGQEVLGTTNFKTFREGVSALGGTYWQADYPLQLTVWFLYLVEFASWDGQAVIGQGNVSSGEKLPTGGTDTMTYHTGRPEGVDGTTPMQYRWIENLWGNVREFRDGIIFSDESVCTYQNPAQYVNDFNGAGAVLRTNKRPLADGCITEWDCDEADASFIFPSATGETGPVPDKYQYRTGVRVMNVGGYFNSGEKGGPFAVITFYAAQNIYGSLGSRLQRLPDHG